MNSLGAVILNYNDYDSTYRCVTNLAKFEVLDYIVIVDNNSSDDSISLLKHNLIDSKIEFLELNKNGGYGYGNNAGVMYLFNKYCCQYTIICNPDTYITENNLKACLDFIKTKNDCIIVAPQMKNSDYTVNRTGAWRIPNRVELLLFNLLVAPNSNLYYQNSDYENDYLACDCVAGSFLLVDTRKFIDIGLYDDNVFLYWEETIIGIKAKKKGYVTYLLPNISFIHNHSVSISKSIKSDYTQQKLMWKSRLYLLETYYKTNFLLRCLDRMIMSYALLERRFIQLVRFIKRNARRDKRGE